MEPSMRAALEAYPDELDALTPKDTLVGLVEQHLQNALGERLMFERGVDPLGKPFPIPPALRPRLLAAKDRQIARIRVALDWAARMPAVLTPSNAEPLDPRLYPGAPTGGSA